MLYVENGHRGSLPEPGSLRLRLRLEMLGVIGNLQLSFYLSSTVNKIGVYPVSLVLTYSASNIGLTLKCELGVVQGH